MPRSKIEDGRSSSPDDALEEVGIRIWDGVPFQFDPNAFQFVLGTGDITQRFDPTDLTDVFAFNQSVFKALKPVSVDSEEYLYMIITTSLIQMPAFRRELAQLVKDQEERARIMRQVKTVIRNVYKKVSPSTSLPRISPTERVKTSFEIGAGANSDGLFRIQTLGNCACLERNPDGYGVFVPQSYPSTSDLSIPLVYNLHNVDNDAERISLYAGAGALAYLVTNRQRLSPTTS